MACKYLKLIETHYRVCQRTVRRHCENGRIPGAYRPGDSKQWRVRKPRDFDQWQKTVVENVGPLPKIQTEALGAKSNFEFKLKTRGAFGKWGENDRQKLGLAMADAVAALVALDILEPAQIDSKQVDPRCKDGLRLSFFFKCGPGRNAYQNGMIEERFIQALAKVGHDAEIGWRTKAAQGY